MFLGGCLISISLLFKRPSCSNLPVLKVYVSQPVGTRPYYHGKSVSRFTLGLSSLLTSIFFIASWAVNEANAPRGFTPEWAWVLALYFSGLHDKQ